MRLAKPRYTAYIMIIGASALILASMVGAEPADEKGSAAISVGIDFLWIAVILMAAKLSNLVTRFGQPPVLGELLAGVVMGNLTLVGFTFFEPIETDFIIRFLAELGVFILLFQVGLESNVQKMLLPDLSFNAHLFLGAILTATSVGITARVFHDLGKLHIPEAQIVMGAAAIDDVLGLTILAVVKAIVETGHVSFTGIGWITGKAVFFLVGAISLGQLLASRLGQLLSKINPGIGMKFILAVSFGLFFAFLAENMGLAPIVGAFAAGLVLEPVHFRHFNDPTIISDINASVKDASPEVKRAVSDVLASLSRSHVQDLLQPLSYFLVPIFFVLTGMQVKLETLFNRPVLLSVSAITAAAIGGKIVAGLVAGRVNKSIIGWGMVPRGEIGLIFAATGKAMGVVSDEIFSIIVIVIMLTTILPPPILNFLLKRHKTPGAPKSRIRSHPS